MKWELGSKTVAVDFQLAGALSAPELQVQRREGEKERDSNRDNYSGALSRHTHALWERTAAHQPSVVHTSFT